jgi:hypothetical protein
MSQDAVLNKYNEGEAKYEEEVSKYLEMNWREITCQRAVGDPNDPAESSVFANGIQDFLFSVSGSTNAFIPALSYFCIDTELQVINGAGVEVPPLLNNNITLSNDVGDALYNSCSFRMGGQDVSVAQSFIPQQGALRRRIDQSGAWLYNIGRNASWIDPDFSRRLNVIAKDGVFHQDGLIDVEGYYTIPTLDAAGAAAPAATFALAVPNTDASGNTVSGTVTLVNAAFKTGANAGSDVKPGDYITIPGQPGYVVKVTAITTATQAAVIFPPGVRYVAVGAVAGGGFYSKKDTESGRYKNQIFWQPGLGIMASYQPINCADIKFSLNPNPSYKRSAVQTTLINQVPGVNYSFKVKNVRFYACQVKMAMPMNTIVDMPLNEIQVQNKNLTSVDANASNSLDFIVPPSTYGIAIFFQSNSAGNNTLLPPTTFATAPGYRNTAPGVAYTGPYNLADVQSIQVTYGGVSKTSTLYTSKYNDDQNQLIQRWIQSVQYASNYNNPGGAENFNDYVKSSYFYFDFSRDRVDSSSYVNVQVVFNSPQEPNTNCFIASFYTRLIRSEYANGQLLQVTAVNA